MTSTAVQAAPTQHTESTGGVLPDGQEATPPSTEQVRAQTAPVMQRRPVSQAPPAQQVIPALPHLEPPCPRSRGRSSRSRRLTGEPARAGRSAVDPGPGRPAATTTAGTVPPVP